MRFLRHGFIASLAFWSTPLFGQSVAVANQPVLDPSAKTYTVFFRVDNAAPLTVLDVTNDPKGATPIRNPETVSSSANRSFWKTEWALSGGNHGAATSRVFLLTAGPVKEILTVSVALRGGDVAVTLVPPTLPVRLPATRTTEFRIVSPTALTGVKIAGSGLVDKKTDEAVPASLLELEDAGGIVTPDGLTLQSGATVRLKVAAGFTLPGQFTGPVRLRSNEKEDLGAIDITVRSTSDDAKRKGAWLLAFGIVTFFVVTVIVKGLTRRKLLILPAARLRGDALLLKISLKKTEKETAYAFPVMLGQDPASLATLIDALQVKELKKAGYLGFAVAIPFTVPDGSAAYQTFLSTSTNRLAVQTLVIRTGVEAVRGMWEEAVQANVQTDAGNALIALDKLGVAGGTAELFRTQVQTEITKLRAAINTAKRIGGAAATSTVVASPTAQQLTVQIEVLSALTWVIWATLTFTVGAATLIWFSDSFGTTQDLLQCFLWGVGVPAVAQGFGGLTNSSATTALSLQFPR